MRARPEHFDWWPRFDLDRMTGSVGVQNDLHELAGSLAAGGGRQHAVKPPLELGDTQDARARSVAQTAGCQFAVEI